VLLLLHEVRLHSLVWSMVSSLVRAAGWEDTVWASRWVLELASVLDLPLVLVLAVVLALLSGLVSELA